MASSASGAAAAPALPGKTGGLFFAGLILYTVFFYTQIAARFPFLAPLRPELLLGSVMVFVALSRFVDGTVHLGENKVNRAALYFFLAALLTIPFAFVKSTALAMFVSLLKFFAIYLMIVAAVDTEERLKVFVYVYVAMIALLFVQPFLLSLRGEGFIYNNHMLRLAGMTGYFAHPNQLGGITSENLPFFYYLMRQERSRPKKLLYLLLIVIAVRVVMLTQSRTGFLGVLAFVGTVWFLGKNRLVSLMAVLLLMAVMWQFAPSQTKSRFLTFTKIGTVLETEREDFSDEQRLELGSMSSRLELIRRGFLIFLDNPVLGVGLDNFKSVNFNRWRHWFPPHNTYIQALAEMGLVGFSAFMYLIFCIARNLREAAGRFRDAGEGEGFPSAVVSAVSVYLVIRLVVSMFGQDLYGNYWWVAGGLSLVLLRVARQRPRAEALAPGT